jgi:hypothetical protein
MSDLSIKVEEPQISKEDPWADDKLGRKACAEMLTSLLAGQTTALTVSVNGEWGSGKTFLLKRWQQQLTNEGYKAIYFNAWEDDFIGDPLVAILGQLRMCLKEDANLAGLVNGLGQVVWTLGSGLSKKFMGLDFEDAAKKARDTAQSNRDVILDNYDALCKTRKELKSSLQEMANELFNQTGKPLVFIVDELDRCRPTFAIETLERIKHLFDINHIVFVLGIDRTQLGESIKSVYGKINFENYLHRFIDLDFMIPQMQSYKFFEVLWENYGVEEFLGNNDRHFSVFKDIVQLMLKMHSLSLREIEQMLKLLSFFMKSCKDSSGSCYPYLLFMFVMLKIKASDLYKRCLNNECTVIEIMDFMFPGGNINPRTHELSYLAANIYASFRRISFREENTDIKELMDVLKNGQLIDNPKSVSKFIRLLCTEQDRKEFYRNVETCDTGQFDSAKRFIVANLDMIYLGTK